MKILLLRMLLTVGLAGGLGVVHGQMIYTYKGNATQTVNGVAQTPFTQTYTLTGAVNAPSQLKFVSVRAGGNQTETFDFAPPNQITHKTLDPLSGAVLSAESGTWSSTVASQGGLIKGVVLLIKISGNTTATDNFGINSSGSPTTQNSTSATQNGAIVKATFSVTASGVTTVTTFNGKQISSASVPSPTPAVTSLPLSAPRQD